MEKVKRPVWQRVCFFALPPIMLITWFWRGIFFD